MTDERQDNSKATGNKNKSILRITMAETTSVELTARDLLAALRRFKKGDFSVRLPTDMIGIDGEIAEAFNDIADLNQGLARELDRVAKVVGKSTSTAYYLLASLCEEGFAVHEGGVYRPVHRFDESARSEVATGRCVD